MRRQLVTVVAVLAAVLPLAACATMRVSSHVEQGLDFARYRTFDWGPADALPTGDPRLDKDPFFQDHVQGAIEKQMAAKGFERAGASATPDLRIHYHATIDRRIDISAEDRRYGRCALGACPEVYQYEAGTLVIDIVDAQANRLVWRGWAQDSVEGVLGNQERLARRIDDAVTKMFLRLPPLR
jgi:hypothetical protein